MKQFFVLNVLEVQACCKDFERHSPKIKIKFSDYKGRSGDETILHEHNSGN